MISVIWLIPQSFSETISTEIFSIEPISDKKWLITWDACAIDEDIRPFFILSSDIDSEIYQASFVTTLYGGKCLSEISGRNVMSVVRAIDPESIEISLLELTKLTDKPRVFILEVQETKLPEYAITYSICAGLEELVSPQILLLYSDITEFLVEISIAIDSQSCIDLTSTFLADDKDSIGVRFATFAEKNIFLVTEENISLPEDQLAKKDNEISKLEQKISDLEKQIKDLQAIIMEQIKVILEILASLKD